MALLKLCKYLVTASPHVNILLMIYNYDVVAHGITVIRYMYRNSLSNGYTELWSCNEVGLSCTQTVKAPTELNEVTFNYCYSSLLIVPLCT